MAAFFFQVIYHLRYLLPRPVPIMAAHALGSIFGPDVRTGKTKELQWEVPQDDVTPVTLRRTLQKHTGISLVMGRLPNSQIQAMSWSLQKDDWHDKIQQTCQSEKMVCSYLSCQTVFNPFLFSHNSSN